MIVTLPGICGSGPDHWQSLWEAQDSRFVRFEPDSWNQPELEAWKAALTRAVITAGGKPLLVAHSLACLLVAHWAVAEGRQQPIAGAFLVSVPDPAGAAFPPEAVSFASPPTSRLPFPSLVIASADDPFGSISYVAERARQWGSGFVLLGKLGHINEASRLGDWPEGAALLEAFRAGTGYEPRDGGSAP